MLDSGISSDGLEQEAHTFGLCEDASPFSAIGTPQHMQMRGLILSSNLVLRLDL